jgi:EmrB/QacA subfamily drug resistance transporter
MEIVMIVLSLSITKSPRPGLRRWLALVVVCLAQLMVMVDASVVNVALPQAQHELHFTQAGLTWIVNAYLITFGGFLLLAGRLGDLLGRKRVFLIGLVVFTAASAVCGLAQDQAELIAARAAQGLGGAVASAAVLAVIVAEFTEAHERTQAMSVYTFVISAGATLGLLVGGVVTQWVSWHWVFFINVPIGLATLAAGAALLTPQRGTGLGQGIDVLGSLLVTASTTLGISAIVESSDHGWASPLTLGLGVSAAVLLVAFVGLESRLRNPILPLHVLTAGNLLKASAVRALLVAGMFSTWFLGTLYLQRVLGYGAIQTGLAFLPLALAIMVLSLGITARIMERFGSMPTLVAGLATVTVGLLLLSRAGEHAGYFPNLFVPFVIIGLGAPLSMMPLLTIAMDGVAREHAGLASGVANAFLQLAGAVGVSALGTVAADRTRSLLEAGQAPLSALTGGTQLAYFVGAGCATAGLLLALAVLRTPRRPAEAGEMEVDRAA